MTHRRLTLSPHTRVVSEQQPLSLLTNTLSRMQADGNYPAWHCRFPPKILLLRSDIKIEWIVLAGRSEYDAFVHLLQKVLCLISED